MIIRGSILENHMHGFFTRTGGVSTGFYSSLNCGLRSGDDRASVLENRRRVMRKLGLKNGKLLTCSQVHGIGVLTISENGQQGNPMASDALVTNQPGLAIGVLTADCAPVLMADQVAGVAAAVHAGWRGAVGGVLEAATRSMEGLGANVVNIKTTIGPCIGQKSYEVGQEFVEVFRSSDFKSETFFKGASRKDHYLFDLPGYVKKRLEVAGSGQIECCGIDSYEDSDRCFSYRRSQHLSEPGYGRSLSVITAGL